MLLYPSFWQDKSENSYNFYETVVSYKGLQFNTQLHGGFSSMSVDILGPRELCMKRYRYLLSSHVVIYDLWGRRTYEGRVEDVSRGDGQVSVKAEGYFMAGNEEVLGQIYYSPSTITDVIDDCIQKMEGTDDSKVWKERYAFTLRDANFNVATLGEKDYTSVKINDVLEEILKLGYTTTDATAIYFAIWGDRTPYSWKEPILSDTSNWNQVNAWLIYNHNVLDFSPSRSRTQVFNKIYGIYEGESGPSMTAAAEDKVSQGIYGIREGTINVGSIPQLGAENLRDYALSRNAYARQEFSLGISGLIRHFGGTIDYPFRIRAGDVLVLMGIDPHSARLDDPLSQATGGIVGMVASTMYSADDNLCRVEVNTKDTRFDTWLARLGIGGSLS